MRLLAIEDEPRILELLQSAFLRAGFVVDTVDTSKRGREALSFVAYDAVILDLGLPDGDGLELLSAMRRDGNKVPVLLLTARDAVEDRVAGLDSGADDYLVKPFAVVELVSRIKALLRRPGHALGVTLEAGNLSLDTIGRDVRVGATPITLRRQELAILELLMRRLGRVVPREVLQEKLYGMGVEPESDAISVH
jgi:DNA-binding response OmpR family regulator